MLFRNTHTGEVRWSEPGGIIFVDGVRCPSDQWVEVGLEERVQRLEMAVGYPRPRSWWRSKLRKFAGL